jgi:hypothetical protein
MSSFPGRAANFIADFANRFVRPLCAFVLLFAAGAAADAELVIVERWPAGENVCTDATLRLTFNQPPMLADSGKIEVCRISDGAPVETIDLGTPLPVVQPVWIEGNTAHVRPRAHSLSPNESYRVRFSSGVFQDQFGNKFAGIADGWTFHTKAPPPHHSASVTVAADGSADFCTVQGAIDQVEPHRHQPAVIFVRKGRYAELVRIPPERTHIHVVGEDRKGTVIACLNNDKLNPGPTQRAVLGVEGNDFVLENLTVQNTTPYKGSQAEAVYVSADRCVLRNSDFLSFQDTLCLNGRVYVSDCYIEGDVDYVWGYGSAVFERCELRTMHDGCVVQARNSEARPGYVFLDCRLTAIPTVKKCWLARIETARFPASQVAFIRCAMGPHILSAGWQVTGEGTDKLRFEEFGSTDVGGHPLDVGGRVSSARRLDVREVETMSASRVLHGSDGWNPAK